MSYSDVHFVFGSNREGRHGAGAALFARQSWGAIYGVPSGPQGRSYAIITKELRPSHPPVTLEEVAAGVATFLDYARTHPHIQFAVSAIGCGLAGFTPSQIAPLFQGAPPNISLPMEFAYLLR
jgi:hypothetical protein